MTRYKVSGRAIDRVTRRRIGRVRSEIINTETNKLFANAKTPLDIEMIYESFWNDLNPRSRQIVKVIGVKKLKK